MWKYVSRRLKDTIERGSHHFEKRRTTALPNTKIEESLDDKNSSVCRWFSPRSCNFTNDSSTNEKRWNFECLTNSWISAITWSSALIAGWYTTQIFNLRKKQHPDHMKIKYSSINDACKKYIDFVDKKALHYNNKCNIEKVIETLIPVVHSVPNENKHSDSNRNSYNFQTSKSSKSDSDLSNVLSSIENKLGLTAIETGHYQDGLNLLRSAANRNHAPALYNLAICYETGVGVEINEKMSMELYRSAALLEHPGALYNLGVYYGQGRGGLGRDPVMALRLLHLAAAQGQEQAMDAIKQLDSDKQQSQEVDTCWGNSYSSDLIMPSSSNVSTLFTLDNVSLTRPFGVI